MANGDSAIPVMPCWGRRPMTPPTESCELQLRLARPALMDMVAFKKEDFFIVIQRNNPNRKSLRVEAVPLPLFALPKKKSTVSAHRSQSEREPTQSSCLREMIPQPLCWCQWEPGTKKKMTFRTAKNCPARRGRPKKILLLLVLVRAGVRPHQAVATALAGAAARSVAATTAAITTMA